MRIFTLFFACSLFLCSFTTPVGIDYRHIGTDLPLSIHVLEVDSQKFEIISARALDKCVGRETVLSLASRRAATAAVNGGFFEIGGYHDGAPCGILKIQGTWYGLPLKPRGAIGWNAREVLFDRVLTHLEGIDFHVDSQTGATHDQQWDALDYIVGGTPLLIQKSQKITDFSIEETKEDFLSRRHARTAIGILSNGNWVFVVIDGKQPELSLGMTIEELADFMQSLGCVDALNLDGGGSSTMFFNGQVINNPTGDGDEKDGGVRRQRAVSDAILILEKN